MKIEKLLYLISAMACSDTSSSGVKYVRLRDVPVKHCILKNCQFCAYSFELDATRFLPQKWSHVGRVVCAKMLLQKDCCDEYLKMNRWMMFQNLFENERSQKWTIKIMDARTGPKFCWSGSVRVGPEFRTDFIFGPVRWSGIPDRLKLVRSAGPEFRTNIYWSGPQVRNSGPANFGPVRRSGIPDQQILVRSVGPEIRPVSVIAFLRHF